MKYPGLYAANSWNANSMMYSCMHELCADATQPEASVGIKYVIEGTEHYEISGTGHRVKTGRYLLVNAERKFGIALPYCAIPVRGMCVKISTALLHDVQRSFSETEERLLDLPEECADAQPDFPEFIHQPGDALGNLLGAIAKKIQPENGRVIENDETLFSGIARALLLSQRLIRETALQIPARKTATRIELYRRIAHAKSIMDEAPESVGQISALAREATLSEFHFMRCFRQLFGISPHQYLIRQRIKKAGELISAKQMPIGEIALRCGFSDLQVFSKAFRKHFGIPPSRY
jgi:AraC family transcriptional regulator